MTSFSRGASHGLPDPFGAEAVAISALAQLRRRLAAIGAERMCFPPTPLAKVIGEQVVYGALPVGLARETLTRRAIHRKEARRRQLRAGERGLLRAIQLA